jgi:rod shape-determining protein MreC
LIRLSPQLRAAIQRTVLPALILLSAAIIVLGKADRMIFDSLSAATADALAPVLQAVSRPLAAVGDMVDRARGFIGTYEENRRLTRENERLLRWQQAALDLAADNQKLRGFVKAVPNASVSYVTARVIANAGGAYVRTVMIDAGSEQHVARGQAAITGEGLVGRMTEVGTRAARVLLITDLNSRIPVVIDASKTNAILAGDNSERPRLIYLSGTDGVKVGDRVVTSGEGGVFPPGLPVGVVSAIDAMGPRVEPFVELSELSYLMVVDYGLSDSLPQPVPFVERATPRNKAAAAKEAASR